MDSVVDDVMRALPAAALEGACDLGEEGIRLRTQAEQWQPQHQIAGQCDVVLPEGVGNHLLRAEVVDAVDLDDDAVPAPPGVEDVAPVRPRPDHLAFWLGNTAAPTAAHEVELAQRLRPTQEVEHHPLNEATSPITPHLEQRFGDGLGGRNVLLHCHRQDEGCLAVGLSPQCRVDGGHLAADPRDVSGVDVVTSPPTRLSNVNDGRSIHAGAARDRDALPCDVEAAETGGDQA